MPIFPALAALVKGAVGKQIIGSVATSLIGGIAERQQAKAQRAQELGDVADQYVRLREAAEAGGFNPLSVLRAGGSGMPNPTPALASGKFVADALGAGVQTFFNGDQMKRDLERDMLEKALMREELRQMQAHGKAVTSRMNFGYEIPQANNYSGVDRANSAPALARAVPAGGRNGVNVAGVTVTENGNWSPAQAFEDRYGDLLSSIYGIGVLGADALKTAADYIPDRYAVAGKPGGAGIMYQAFPKAPKAPTRVTRFDPNHRDGYYTAPWMQ